MEATERITFYTNLTQINYRLLLFFLNLITIHTTCRHFQLLLPLPRFNLPKAYLGPQSRNH